MIFCEKGVCSNLFCYWYWDDWLFFAGQKFPDRTIFDPPRNLLAAAID